MSYVELSIEERATLQVSRAQGMSIRQVAAVMERSPSTICRELQRNQKPDACYCARHAQQLRQQRR
ncbi:hypothetical protein BTW10_15165 [Chromohalobacter japonicus]|uniref:Transposase IS30-like HTH domain-containing protein n=1 Tax=Chromohalobacter japonicus TaxID=223900 RepID=A0A1Q8T825_9GAMM|nr:hypothetical protein BTW10_18350 [Chromohalobacter japonicus]OLO10339.1 hypothetical protein BTW10_15165 [Chromohalobacter japonicus]